MGVARRLRGELPRLLVYGALGAGALVWLAPFADQRVAIEPRRGAPVSATPLRFVDPPAASAAAPSANAAVEAEIGADGARPRGIVLFIGDGMGFSQVHAARLHHVGPDGLLRMERMPVVGWHHTHSARSIYTDSAAGATALSTGVKTLPGRIAVDPDGAPLTTLVESARARGLATGLITDSALFDATPMAFAVQVSHRREVQTIVNRLPAAGVDLLIGGYDPAWSARLDPVPDVVFDEAGYAVARDWPTFLRQADDGAARQVGLLPLDALPGAAEPSLATVTRHALERLMRDPDGFFLLVETEETDTGGHNENTRQVIDGVLALDAAIAAALETIDAAGDEVLVLVTADHETGGLALLTGSAIAPLGVRYATGNHTAEPVPIFARGPGAARFGAVLDNTEVGRRMAALLLPVGTAGGEALEEAAVGGIGDGIEVGADDLAGAEAAGGALR
ncbi:MAG: alkaline phosphatase [Acidobacteriota bacterium]